LQSVIEVTGLQGCRTRLRTHRSEGTTWCRSRNWWSSSGRGVGRGVCRGSAVSALPETLYQVLQRAAGSRFSAVPAIVAIRWRTSVRFGSGITEAMSVEAQRGTNLLRSHQGKPARIHQASAQSGQAWL